MAAMIDLCRFLPTLGGTTDFVYSSSVPGCQSPTLAGAANGVKYKCYAVSNDLTQWELFEGAYNSGTGTFPRTTVLYNSSGTGTATGQSGAGTKINFSTIPQVAVVGLAEDIIQVDAANAFTSTQKAQARTNVAAVLKGHLWGLTLSAAGSTATYGIAAGEAADGASADLMSLGSAYTKTTSGWAVGTGNGSLDTGTIAINTWYHVFLIKRPDTGVVDVLCSTSATSPTMPSNYTLFRRIGSMKTNGSSQWIKFTQNGDEFLWDQPVADYNGASCGTTIIAWPLASVPLGVRVNAILNMGAIAPAGGDCRLIFMSGDVTGTAGSATCISIGGYPTANMQVWAQLYLRTDTSQNIRGCSMSVGTDTVIIGVVGWVDSRGRIS